MFKKVDSSNRLQMNDERVPLSEGFTEKFGLVFVLAQEHTFS